MKAARENRTAPAVEMKKGYEGGGEGVKIGTGKEGFNSTVFMPATLWSQHKKSVS